ncbi:unnamed protein product [Closterium sp. NIES-54]
MATLTAVAAARGGQRRSLPLSDDPTPQQLREWVLQRARPGGGGFGFLHTTQRRQLSQLETFSPQVLSQLFPQRCVTSSIEAATPHASESAAALGAGDSAAALGANESTTCLGAHESPATCPSLTEALHTFTLDSRASHCFFRDYTSLTPLVALVLVSLADPIGGPAVARASTVLPCPAVPSGFLSGLHLPTFSTNLVSNAAIQDVGVDTIIPGGQRVAICTCSRTGHHLAMFTRRPGSSLYTLTTACAQVAEAGQVAVTSQVSASGQLAASCSCRVLSHQTLLWHNRFGHPSLLRLQSMHSRLFVSDLPRSLPSLPRLPAVPCLPCIEGQQRAAPHSSEFPSTTAPLQTLHMDFWGSALVGGTDQERYFVLVVDDYTRYTTVFPLRCKADDSGVLIPWICATRRQLREWFIRDLPILRLHSDRAGEFSSDLLMEIRSDKGIHQLFTLLAYSQQNGIAERCIGLIMEVSRTSMIHAAAPHFLWPFAGALSLVRDANASKLSSRTLRCIFLGFPTDAAPWQFFYPRERRVFSSQKVTFDDSICFYRLHAHASHLVPVAPLFLVPVPPLVDPLPPQGPAPSGVSQVDPPILVEPLEISSDSSGPAEVGDPAADDTAATRRSPCLETPPGFPPRPSWPPPRPAVMDSRVETAGAEPRGAETEGEGFGGAAPWGAGSGGAATRGACSWGAATAGADSGGLMSPSGGGALGDLARGSLGGGGYGPAGGGAASPGGTAGAGGARAGGIGGSEAAGPGGASTRGARAARAGGAAGAQGARGAGGATGATGTGGAGGTTGARGPGAAGASAAGAAGAGGAGAAGAGAGGAGAASTALRRPFFYPQPQSSLPPPDSVLCQVLSFPSSTGLPLPLLCPPTEQSLPQLLPGSPLPAPAPHIEVTESLTEHRELETRASTPVCAHHVARPRPPAVPGTHGMALVQYIGHGARAWRSGFSGTHRTLRRFLGRRPGDSAFVTGLHLQSWLLICLVEVHSFFFCA